MNTAKFIKILPMSHYGNGQEMSSDHINVMRAGRVCLVESVDSDGTVQIVSGHVFGASEEGVAFEYVDTLNFHIEINGEKMTLAALLDANDADGCEPIDDFAADILMLEIGESWDGFHMERITRIAPPREVYFVARKRDGHDRYDMKGFVWHSKEDAIGDLYTKWQMWMDAAFIYNIPGEVLQEADGDEPAIIASEELGWYSAGKNSIGEGRADFSEADYPNQVQQWIDRGIDSFRDDVWVWSVYTETEYR